MVARCPNHVIAVLETLQAGGFKAYLVGGCVRDSLLGRLIHDFDVATNAHPHEVMSLFPRTIGTGLKHGTVTVLTDDTPVEVTTYRVDMGYSDGRRPDRVVFTQRIEDDLARRDFTVNAMALDLTGDMVDPYAGQSDLQKGVIRAVGNAEERFREDGLRILRAIRFAAQLSFHIAPETLNAMATEANRLRSVSRERIGQEVAKIARDDWWSVVALLTDGPFLDVLPDPLTQLRPAFAQLASIGQDLSGLQTQWHACIRNLVQDKDACEPALTASVAFWAFLANLQPPATVSLARTLAWSHDWSQNIRETLEWLYRDPDALDTPGWRRALYEGRPFCLHTACAILDFWNPVENRLPTRQVRFVQALKSQPVFSLQDLAITGHELMQLGFSGPQIGHVKRSLLTAVLHGRVPNQPAALYAEAERQKPF